MLDIFGDTVEPIVDAVKYIVLMVLYFVICQIFSILKVLIKYSLKLVTLIYVNVMLLVSLLCKNR